MTNFLKTTAIAAGVLVAASAANASIIDFTDSSSYSNGSITLTGASTMTGAAAGGWSGVAAPGAINLSETGPGPVGVLDGDNDGLGIGDDELTFPGESFTITFNNVVTIVGLYFLDHFAPEQVHLEIDGGAHNFTLLSFETFPGIGYSEFDGLAMTGTEFTFTVGSPNEIAEPDYALAAIDLAPIPLPAGILLLGGALAGLGLARRRSA